MRAYVIFFSLLLVLLVFVTIIKQEERRENIQKKIGRKIIYAKRIQQIQKTCIKYGLSVSEDENIHNSKFKKFQSEFSRNSIPPYTDKVYILFTLQIKKNFFQAMVQNPLSPSPIGPIRPKGLTPKLWGHAGFL